MQSIREWILHEDQFCVCVFEQDVSRKSNHLNIFFIGDKKTIIPNVTNFEENYFFKISFFNVFFKIISIFLCRRHIFLFYHTAYEKIDSDMFII